MERIEKMLARISEGIWLYFLLPCVLLGGVWLSWRTRFYPLRSFPRALKETVGALFASKKNRQEGSLTPFQALTTALAGTMGTGSIVGTCQALALGGYGAVFWMWVVALLGMVIKFCEVTLAIRFRRRSRDGEWQGGPMYYIRHGMGENYRILSVLFAIFATLASLGMGNLAQCNSISSSTVRALEVLFPDREWGRGQVGFAVGFLCAFLVFFSVFRGLGRLGRITERIIPFLTLFFVFLSLAVIFFHAEALPRALGNIVRGAFKPSSLLGAGAGFGVKNALQWGLRRAAFSNEAGLGSAAIAHAAAQTEHPVRQGYFGIFEVFADTVVVCTLTALTVAVALPQEAVFSSGEADSALIVNAIATVTGERVAAVAVALCLILFAFSTLLGWSFYGCRCAEFLLGSRIRKPYGILFAFLCIPGSLLSMELLWNISDLFNALMALPNLVALFFLCPTVNSLIREFSSPSRLSNPSVSETKEAGITSAPSRLSIEW